jgi:hypothetical protein
VIIWLLRNRKTDEKYFVRTGRYPAKSACKMLNPPVHRPILLSGRAAPKDEEDGSVKAAAIFALGLCDHFPKRVSRVFLF